MSFIRCLNNPEGLYVFESIAGFIQVHHLVPPPLASKQSPAGFQVPKRAFYEVCRRWATTGRWRGGASYGKCLAREELVLLKTGRPVPSDKDIPDDGLGSDYRVRFQYDDHFVYLWGVTWAYVVANVMEQLAREKRKTKKRTRR